MWTRHEEDLGQRGGQVSLQARQREVSYKGVTRRPMLLLPGQVQHPLCSR